MTANGYVCDETAAKDIDLALAFYGSVLGSRCN